MAKSLLCLVSAGSGGQDEHRARLLAGRLAEDMGASVEYHFIDKGKRKQSEQEVSRLLQKQYDLVYLEGTGIAAGWPLAKAGKRGQRYVVSSGDPVGGFFRTTKGKLAGAIFGTYEKILMRRCTAFVGWTPYLTGRSLELGAPRAVTVEGGADLSLFTPPTARETADARAHFGIPADHIVCCVVGSIQWNGRQNYAYGLELVETLKRLQRQDVTMLIVGDGSGREVLETKVPAGLKSRVVFTGRIPREQVAQALHASDIGFVTQTLDGLGSYRLTTKLPEYLASGLAVAMSPIPGFFDYVWPAGWALPAEHPGSAEFHARCAAWLEGLTRSEVDAKRALAPQVAAERFDYRELAARFSEFVRQLLDSPTT